MTTTSTEGSSPRESSFCRVDACEEFDVDLLLRSLAHPRRREVLCCLDAEPEWTRGNLAATLGTIEAVTDRSTEKEAEVALAHSHLPLLEEARLVEVDGRRVERGENFQRVRELVDAAVSVL